MDAEHRTTEPADSPERQPGERELLNQAGDSFDSRSGSALASSEEFAYREVQGDWPVPSLLLSLALHLLALTLPLPELLTRVYPPTKPLSTVRIEYDLRWAGGSLFLPPISPRPDSPASELQGRDEPKRPAPSIDSVTSQTIISAPPQPTHPTQTLLSQFGLEHTDVNTQELHLPNLVIPPARRAAPELTPDLNRLRLPDSSAVPAASLPLPRRPQSDAELALTDSRLENLYPRLTAEPKATTDLPPDVATSSADGATRALPHLLALSAQPAPPSAVLELPQTQLRAQFATGRPAEGAPGGAPEALSGVEGAGTGGMGTTAGGLEAPHVFVAPAGPAPPGALLVGPGRGREQSPAGAMATPTPGENPQATQAKRQRAEELLQGITPGTRPTTAARVPRIYTIYINMPNLTSQTGSWVLRFAEPGFASQTAAGGAADVSLEEPVAITKIDPRYPPAARRARLEGSVYLYGIITEEGRVSEVAVVRGLDEQLDASAVEAFRRWRFKPGRKNGTPVPLEVVVQIPFRLQALF